MSKREEDRFKSDKRSKASRLINKALESFGDHEWAVSELIEKPPEVNEGFIRSHIQRLTNNDPDRGLFLIRVRRGVYQVNKKRPRR